MCLSRLSKALVLGIASLALILSPTLVSNGKGKLGSHAAAAAAYNRFKIITYYSDESYSEIVGGYIIDCTGRATRNEGQFTPFYTVEEEPCCGDVLC
ncbi:MAG: DUF6289 family protein [Acidobacteriota bacterium]